MSEVEIIIGFNGSGKTLFLNSYIRMKNIKNNEKILVLCFDRGNTSINYVINDNIKIKFVDYNFQIDDNKLLYLIEIHKPHFIFIEGDYILIKYIDNILSSKLLKDKIFITSRINIINSKHINLVLKNRVCNIYSNIVIINNFDDIELYNNDLFMIKAINRNAFVFCVNHYGELYEKFKNYKLIRNDFYENIFKCIKYLI
jgi:hypothetical protein